MFTECQPVPTPPTTLPPQKSEKGHPELDLHRLRQNTLYGLTTLINPNTGLPIDHNGPNRLDLTTPSNIAVTLASLGLAYDQGHLPSNHALNLAQKTIHTLQQIPRHHGLFPQWINALTGHAATHWPESNKPIDIHASSVDNGHLAVALVIVSHLIPPLADQAHQLYTHMDFSNLYNQDTGLLQGSLPFTADSEPCTWCYGTLYSEPLCASLIGITKGDLPPSHLYRLAMSQYHLQKTREVTVGPTLRTWGGALFEALMPSLFFGPILSHPVWQQSSQHLIDAQIEYARQHNQGLWGFSPAGYRYRNGQDYFGYTEFGTPHTGIWTEGYHPWIDPYQLHGIEDDPIHVISPHAALLALSIDPSSVEDLIAQLITTYPDSNSSHGLPESYTPQGAYTPGIFALTQSLSYLASADHLSPRCLSRAVNQETGIVLKPLLQDYNPLDPYDTVTRLKNHTPPNKWPLLDLWLQQALTPNLPCPPPTNLN